MSKPETIRELIGPDKEVYKLDPNDPHAFARLMRERYAGMGFMLLDEDRLKELREKGFVTEAWGDY